MAASPHHRMARSHNVDNVINLSYKAITPDEIVRPRADGP